MFYISPSLIKKFFNKGNEVDYCPRRIMDTYINPVEEVKTTLSMESGRFFESLCLGRTRDGEVVDDLNRKKNGTKTIDQVRIEEQALVFKQKSKKYMMIIDDANTQTEINLKLNDEFTLQGHPDIFPTPVITKDGLKMACFDLKLTKDIDCEFLPFCWGRPDLMDHTQGIGYIYIIENISLGDNEHLSEILTPSVIRLCNANEFVFRYWVFSYGAKGLTDKFVPITYDAHAKNEFKELLRKTMSLIEYNDKTGWKTNPCYKLCNDCPLKATCSDYDVFN